MKRLPKMLISLGLICGLHIGGFSQKGLERPLNEWKQDTALSVLNNSPWAFAFSDINIAFWSKTLKEEMMFGTVSSTIILRVYSATTVRRAMARLNQIAGKYDKLSADEKVLLDRKNAALLKCELCQEYYILLMTQPASPDASKTLVGQRFRQLTLSDLKSNIFLTNDAGQRRELFQFVEPLTDNGVAIFYFKKTDESGAPLITSSSKQLVVNFRLQDVKGYPFLNGIMAPKVYYDVAKMTIGGNVDL